MRWFNAPDETLRAVVVAAIESWPAGIRPGNANPGAVQPVLFTVGYEQHLTPESLVAELAANGIQRLLDVRELPMSRRQGFSKTALRDALATAGVAYHHDRALGNPKSYRDLYRSGRQLEGERLYRQHLRNGSAHAVDQLAVIVAEDRTCILCYEQDHRSCHRAVIVEELKMRLPSLHVEHL